MLLSLSASVASGQTGKTETPAGVLCSPGNPKECSVDLKLDQPAPIPGILLSPHLFAWYAVQVRDIDASVAAGMKHQTEIMDIRLGAAAETCQSDITMRDETIADRDETIDQLDSWHRSPMMWASIGAFLVSVIWVAVKVTEKGVDTAFAQTIP